jgi:two-component system sensor histidine kinase DegS
MELTLVVSSKRRWKDAVTSSSFWIVVASLAAITLLHYLTPQVRFLSSPMNTFLSRHAVERILFIFPIAGATFAFGQRGGSLTLSLAILIMLPRALWLSPSPVDALVETTATAMIGYLVTWMIEFQAREKALRQKTILQLRAVHEVTTIVTGSLELEQILNDALDKILEVTSLDAGLVFFLERQSRELVLAASRGISKESITKLERLKPGEGFYGRVAQCEEVMVISDSSQDPRLAGSSMQIEELRGQIAVPLKSKKVQGILAVATRHPHEFLPEELELVTAIGNQIGVAIENARLHQDVARQLQIQQQLNEVVERITSELELGKILPKVLQIAEELVGADGGGIALFDQERENIHYLYLHNLPQELADVPIPKGKGVAGEVMSTGLPVVVENYQVYPGAIAAFAEKGITGVVAVPIMSGDRSFGALTLVSLEKVNRFSDWDITILSGIGRQTGIAIENAHLYENLRFYIHQITQAQEDERKRIARDLHDETIQMLIVISRRLEVLATTLSEQLPETALTHLESLQELIGNTLKGIRRFLQDLRPPTLDHLGLMATLEGLVTDLREKDEIETTLQVTGEVRRLDPDEELVLFRIVQEALHNIRRHSRASQAKVQVAVHPDSIRISVEDNGRGFHAPERISDLVSSGRLGLIGMYERARTLDGTLLIRSEPGQGTVVIVEAPV